MKVKWVKSEQMLADCLTKVMAGTYTRKVFTSGMWTFGPCSWAPTLRNRKLEDPHRVQTDAEAERLTDALQVFAARAGYDTPLERHASHRHQLSGRVRCAFLGADVPDILRVARTRPLDVLHRRVAHRQLPMGSYCGLGGCSFGDAVVALRYASRTGR